MEFPDLFRRATGGDPYPWQERVAAEGLPEVVDIETGAGKTAGLVLGWLYRLLHHPESAVRLATPAWLVFALPMRSLVNQTEGAARGWVESLGHEDVAVHRLLGGEGKVDSTWRERPGRPTVIVATIDMVLSRQLMRGYASSRWMWPVEFGLLHAGCHLVFDEVQLLGPSLPTSRQLDAFRRSFGVAAPCTSTWMSATLDPARLRTVDNPVVPTPMVLESSDRERGLERRLSATRLVGEREATEPKALARLIVDEHRSGTLTLVVVNTVKRAQETFAQLQRLLSVDPPESALLHSRFRHADRASIVDQALTAPIAADGPGRVLVATQVVEAGVDISAATLITDNAPWSSIVQRAGRCNRAGEFNDARMLWTEAPRPEPYEKDDLSESAKSLRALNGTDVTSTALRELGRQVRETEAVVPVLRKRDLIELFDTSPDLIGNDIDVARFIRADGDTDVHIAWRTPAVDDDDDTPFFGGPLRPDEMCRVPISDARKWLKGSDLAWTPDHLAPRRRWRRMDPTDLRPGGIVVVDAAVGGYDPATGWDGTSKRPVPVIEAADSALEEDGDTNEISPVDEATADDPATYTGAWVRLDDHLDDTRRAAQALLDEARMDGLSSADRDAVVKAAALHDLGKVHDVFQDTLVRSAESGEAPAVRLLVPLAKSAGTSRARHSRPHFRHELVSTLLIDAHAEELVGGDIDTDLVRYLVASHHGRVRLAIRSIPGEQPPDHPEARVALGVVEGDVVPAVTVGGTQIGATTIQLDAMELGGSGSWTAMALRLRDRPDLGPFRLAALEALVRLADWRASESPATTHTIAAIEEAP